MAASSSSLCLVYSGAINALAAAMYSFVENKKPMTNKLQMRIGGLGNLIGMLSAAEFYAARQGAALETRKVLATMVIAGDLAFLSRAAWCYALGIDMTDDPTYELFGIGTGMAVSELLAASYCLWSTVKEENELRRKYV